MSHSRRRFLANTLGASAVISLSAGIPRFLLQAAESNAATPAENILVVVQLTGGNDGLNTIVPYADDVYHHSRGTLAQTASQVLKIDDYLGFHPALIGFAKLLEDHQFAVVQGVGYPNPDRSHFSSMDIWQSAQRKPGKRPTGWIGRYLDEMQAAHKASDLPALHLGSENRPLALEARDVDAASIHSVDRFRLDRGEDSKFVAAVQQANRTTRAAGNELLGFAQQSMTSALASSQRISESLGKYKTDVKYPPTAFARKLSSVAQLIDASLKTRVYYVALDGFDTHSGQATNHAGLLGQLSGAVQAFIEDIKQHGHQQRVVVVTFSEFGRRVKENASRGTDHGAAAPMMLAGASLKAGIVGKHPSLTDLDDGDIKHHTDFRQVYATLLEDWLGWKSATVLGDTFEKLPLFKTS